MTSINSFFYREGSEFKLAGVEFERDMRYTTDINERADASPLMTHKIMCFFKTFSVGIVVKISSNVLYNTAYD